MSQTSAPKVVSSGRRVRLSPFRLSEHDSQQQYTGRNLVPTLWPASVCPPGLMSPGAWGCWAASARPRAGSVQQGGSHGVMGYEPGPRGSVCLLINVRGPSLAMFQNPVPARIPRASGADGGPLRRLGVAGASLWAPWGKEVEEALPHPSTALVSPQGDSLCCFLSPFMGHHPCTGVGTCARAHTHTPAQLQRRRPALATWPWPSHHPQRDPLSPRWEAAVRRASVTGW